MINKNEEYIVDIIDNGYEGEGIAKINDFTVFVQGAIKGEKCKILIVKVNKNFGYGKILEIITKSDKREDEDCGSYKRCGGCSLRHIKYDYTLEMKREMVQNLVNKMLSSSIKVNHTIGMDYPYNYRNKLQYPIGKDKDGNKVMGMYAKRSHEIIPVNNCIIQNKKSQDIANEILSIIKDDKIDVYDEKTEEGKIRHIVIKNGINTDEIMCIIVTNEENIGDEQKIISRLVSKVPNIKTIVKNINNKIN